MAEKGWIKLHRQLQECPMWYSERFSKGQAWVDLLLLANHSDKKILFNGEFIIVERGQYLTSMVKLAEKWKWSRPTVTKFLNLLEKDKMITRSSNNSKTLITIENYGIYQDFREDDLQPTLQLTLQGSLQPTLQESCNPINNPLYTNNNDKNIKNIYMSENSDDKEQSDTLQSDFQIIYKSYPKKVGKTKGFEYYKAWVTKGRVISGVRRKLTNKQIWDAIAKYKREMDDKCTELEYYKNFDTFMNKAILDYVEE